MKARIVSVALSTLLLVSAAALTASPSQAQGKPVVVDYLAVVLYDAYFKTALPDDLSPRLTELVFEDIIAPHTGETPEQAARRVSGLLFGEDPDALPSRQVQYAAIALLVSSVRDALDTGAMSETAVGLMADLLVEYLIVPHSGETPEEAEARLTILLREKLALNALFEATGGSGWERSRLWTTDWPVILWGGVEVDIDGHILGLYLRGNRLSGQIPPDVRNLVNLEWLDLSDNSLNGSIPTGLSLLSRLKHLDLTHNRLTGRIPPVLGDMDSLVRLDLQDNRLTGRIPPELGKLDTLEELQLGANDLRGPIPPELGDLRSLAQLNLWRNYLVGPVPPELGNLDELGLLILSANRLVGPIPPELGNLANLGGLDLSFNELSGPIPPELEQLKLLEEMNLSGNQLTGEIPAEMGGMAAIEVMDLSGNELTGQIPLELSNLERLTWLSLGGNWLTGCIPIGLSVGLYNDFPDTDLPFCAE